MRVIGVLSLLCMVLPVLAETSRPNIVVILADDMGYGDVRAYNAESKVPTPNLDTLAAAGMRFTDAHSSTGAGRTTWPAFRFGIRSGRNDEPVREKFAGRRRTGRFT